MLKKANSLCLCALLLLQLLLVQPAFAQTDEDGLEASLAYLDRAIFHYNEGDAQGAARSIEAALLYSDIPADLFYLKALILSDADAPRGDVLGAVYAAFNAGRRWFRFEAEPAAVFAASLLTETGRFEEALFLLDSFVTEPSADTAYIRCKSAYALGDFAQGRNAVGAALSRWPSDERFPLLFFQFEEFYRLDSLEEEEPSGEGEARTLEIASWIVRAWNILGNPEAPAELALASVPFVRLSSPRDAARIVARLWNMGGFASLSAQAAPFLAVEALRENIAGEDDALDAFFSLAESDKGIPIAAVEYLGALAASSSSQKLREEIAARLSGFSGVISADSNGDLVADTFVSYRLGRPHSAVYDLNQDGYPDMIAECGFGEPTSVLFPRLSAEIDYQAYPYATSIRLGDIVFMLRPASFECAPLAAEALGFGFLSPAFLFLSADSSFAFPSEDELSTASALKTESGAIEASSGDEAAFRRETFYDESGLPASQREIINGALVSRTIFSGGRPAECDRDDDGDGHFETKILYGEDGAETLLVDTDGDMIFNFAELTALDGSVRQSWFEAGDSSPSVQWVKTSDGESFAVWLHPESGEEVTARFGSLAFSDDSEGFFSVSYRGETRNAFRDAQTGVWWLDELPDEFSPPASADIAFAASQLKQSALAVVFSDVNFEGGFVRVLKIGGYLFAETVYSE